MIFINGRITNLFCQTEELQIFLLIVKVTHLSQMKVEMLIGIQKSNSNKKLRKQARFNLFGSKEMDRLDQKTSESEVDKFGLSVKMEMLTR